MKLFPRRTRWARLHTKEDMTFEGIFLGLYAGHYVFESCALLSGPDATKTELRGRVEFPAADCRMVQVLR